MINKPAAAPLSALLTIGLSVAGMALPASAAEKENVKVASSGAAVSAASAVAARRGEKLYCLREAYTGTRIPRKTCMTEQGWKAEGVELRGR